MSVRLAGYLGMTSFWLLCAAAQAAVTGIEIQSRTAIGEAGGIAYELLAGKYSGELDPANPHNALINDLQLAPRNARGRVEYTATFALARPVDAARASGVLFYDTPNRGFFRIAPDPDGHLHLVSGWQGDIPAAPDKQTLSVPVAHQRDGRPITGPVLVRWIDVPEGTRSVPIQGGIVYGVNRPDPVVLDSRRARLLRRTSDADPGSVIPASEWAFADCSDKPFPGAPDAHRLCLKQGFSARFAYELRYEGKDPQVLGIGFAAVRDLVAFLRHATSTSVPANPLAGQLRNAILTGVSQSGNFVRSYIHLGFNAAEDGRMVFDGAHPQIAARQVPLNFRFAVPGGAATLYEPGSEAVLWWGDHRDSRRGRGTTSLLTRCRASSTCPKIFESFGAAELWGLRMSPVLVGTDGQHDIALPDNVRRYYFPGVTHGGGTGGFEIDAQRPKPAAGCTLPANPNPSWQQVRALNVALVDWIVRGIEPPASRYPRLDRRELVSLPVLAADFPRIPGAPSPQGKLNEFLAYDFGSSFNADDLSGAVQRLPPRIDRSVPSLVVRVNADGNEVAGIPSVQHQVPLGTYLGWNEQASGYYAGAGCGFQGGYVPFARTRADRLASGDPRLSLEERYGTQENFVARVKAAAAQLVTQRFLLPADADALVAQAERSQVLSAAVSAGSAVPAAR